MAKVSEKSLEQIRQEIDAGIASMTEALRSGAPVVWSGIVTSGRLRGMRFRNTIRMIDRNRMMITFGSDGTSAMFLRVK